MTQKHSLLLQLIESFGIRAEREDYGQEADATFECSFQEATAALAIGMQAGRNVHPPVAIQAGDRLLGLQLRIADPQGQDGSPGKLYGAVNLYGSPRDKTNQTDLMAAAYGLLAVAVAQFISDVESEAVK